MSVYLIRCRTTGLVKIGHSKTPEKRLSDLQVGSATKLEMIAQLDGGPDEERQLHYRFDAYRSHGEWFALPLSAIRELVPGTEPVQRMFDADERLERVTSAVFSHCRIREQAEAEVNERAVTAEVLRRTADLEERCMEAERVAGQAVAARKRHGSDYKQISSLHVDSIHEFLLDMAARTGRRGLGTYSWEYRAWNAAMEAASEVADAYTEARRSAAEAAGRSLDAVQAAADAAMDSFVVPGVAA